MGFSILDTYDSELCGSRCDSVKGCSSFNLCKSFSYLVFQHSFTQLTKAPNSLRAQPHDRANSRMPQPPF